MEKVKKNVGENFLNFSFPVPSSVIKCIRKKNFFTADINQTQINWKRYILYLQNVRESLV
jgi:hypothetical protein